MSDTAAHLWLPKAALILASGSRTRAELLANAGLVARVVKPSVDERAIEAELEGLNPINLAHRLAEAKAREVAGRHPDCITIGADQVLDVDGVVFHKPANLAEAHRHLDRLQGRRHALHSAVAIVADGKSEVFHGTAWLTMRYLDAEAITAYLFLAGEHRVTSSVGGYQLEGLGIHLFERVEGDHSTVLGLPLIPLLAKLRMMGALAIA